MQLLRITCGLPFICRARSFSALLLAGILCAAMPAQAYRLSPIVMDFEPSGRGAVRNFELFNETAESVPVEIRIVRRTMDLDGTETLIEELDDFTVFPPQVVLDPGQTQVVQVRWTGDPAPDQELPFRIIAEQLPVNLDLARAPGAEITMLVRYEGSIYVLPENAAPEVQLESLERVTTGSGREQLELVLANNGKAHGIVAEASLSLRDSSGKRIDLGAEALAPVNNTNILAGSKRRYLLALPADIADGPIQGVFQAETRR